jgi:hypothetical protein
MLLRVKGTVFRGILATAGFLLAHSTASVGQQFDPPTYEDDPRLLILKSFLDRHRSPAASLADEFLEAADRHDLDWRLLPGIAIIESGGGKTSENNNIFGWDSGRIDFTTVEEGIHFVAYRLANSKLYRDKQLNAVLLTYNPYPDYPARVRSVMRRIGPLRVRAYRSAE